MNINNMKFSASMLGYSYVKSPSRAMQALLQANLVLRDPLS